MDEISKVWIDQAEAYAERDDDIRTFEVTELDGDDEYLVEFVGDEVPSYVWTLFSKWDVDFRKIDSDCTIRLTFTYNGG